MMQSNTTILITKIIMFFIKGEYVLTQVGQHQVCEMYGCVMTVIALWIAIPFCIFVTVISNL